MTADGTARRRAQGAVEGLAAFLRASAWHWALAALALLLLVPLIPVRDLWEPEELRYAEIVREMHGLSGWFLLKINGEAYPDKPPLFFWLIRVLSGLTGGIGPWSMRLPAVLAGAGCAVLTLEIGRRLIGRRAGVLAGLLLLATPFFTWSTSEARMDSLFTFWMLCAGLCGVLYIDSDGGRRWTGAGVLLFAAFALMTKGPAGLLLPVVAVAAFLLVARRFDLLKRLPWGRGLIAAAVVILPWLVATCVLGGWDFAKDLLFRQNVGRYVTPWIHQKHGVLTYFWQFPAELLPWTLFIPFAVWNIASAQERHRRRGFLYALCWWAAVFVLFTFSQSKRSIYLLPCFPWAAILLAGTVEGLAADASAETDTRRATLPMALTAAGLALTGAAVLAVQRRLEPIVEDRTVPLAVGMAATGLCTLALVGFREYRRLALGVFLGGAFACWLFGSLAILPLVDEFKSARGFLTEVRRYAGDKAPVTIRRAERTGYGVYLDRTIPTMVTDEQIRQSFEENPLAFCIIKARDMDAFRLDPPFRFWPVARGRVGGRSHVLISNVPMVPDPVRLPAEGTADVQAGLFMLNGLSGARLVGYSAREIILRAHQPDVSFTLDTVDRRDPAFKGAVPDSVTVTVRNFPGGLAEVKGPGRSPEPAEAADDSVRVLLASRSGPWRIAVRPEPGEFKVAVFGGGRIDSPGGAAARRRLADAIRRAKPAFVVELGDMVNLGLPGEYRQAADWADSLGVPCYGLAGPEDLWTSESELSLFNQLFGGEPRSFRFGRVQWIFVNSRTGVYGARQLEWLRDELTRAKGPAVLFVHHPPFAPAQPEAPANPAGEAAALRGLLRTPPVELAFAGSGAFHWDGTIDGVRWIVTRGGVEKIRTGGVPTTVQGHHFVLVRVNGTSVKAELTAVDGGGSAR